MSVSEIERTREQLERTVQMHRALGDILRLSLEPLDLASILTQSLQVLTSVPWLAIEAQGSVFLVDAGSDVLVMKAHIGLPCELLAQCHRVPFGRCLCGQAAATRQVVFADRVDERHVGGYAGMLPHGHYCIPLVGDGDLFGVLNLYVKEGHAKHPEEQQFLESAADVLVGVIKRKQAEESLRESEERFDLAVRGTNAGVWDWNLTTNEVYFSPRWKKMLGYEEEEITNHFLEWESRLHPDDRDRALATVREYLAGEVPDYELEHRLRHKDGDYRWILARGAAVRDEKGTPYRMVGSHLDITERNTSLAFVAAIGPTSACCSVSNLRSLSKTGAAKSCGPVISAWRASRSCTAGKGSTRSAVVRLTTPITRDTLFAKSQSAQERSRSAMGSPSRTSVMGRPTFAVNSCFGSIPIDR